METNQINFLEEMSNFIFTTKYARFNEVNKRRETLSETVDRVSEMHLRKYSFLPEEDINRIKWAFEMVKEKKVVPSMRSMQFGGKAVEAHNSRIYNCGVRHIDSLRAFAEFFYCLLSGTGMTAGVSEKVISNLPNLVSKEDKTGSVITYVIDDTIEGWADSVETLLMCYHKNTPFSGRKIVFDYSKIRPKGTQLKTGGGKAPGHEGLQQAHRKIKNLLDYCIEELNSYLLRSIDIYDILMHCADAVLSGGIRRAATAVIFDCDDNLMLNAKINQKVSSFKRFEKIDNLWEGTVTVKKKKYEVKLTDYEYETLLKENKEISWIHTEPQRARSNNSVLLIRDKTTKIQFEKIVERTKQYGEPGFVFADDELALFNPCLTKDTLINTNRGNLNVIQIIDLLNKEEDLFALSFNTINRTL
jgi:ribonucleoside-triphosphate reductase